MRAQSLSLSRWGEGRTLACDTDLALIATFAPGLAHTVLVQLVRNRFDGRSVTSLYAVYREGDTTFDAIVGFEPGEPTRPLGDVLRTFIRGGAFQTAILGPLQEQVRSHFGR
jgi:hypothetical protein